MRRVIIRHGTASHLFITDIVIKNGLSTPASSAPSSPSSKKKSVFSTKRRDKKDVTVSTPLTSGDTTPTSPASAYPIFAFDTSVTSLTATPGNLSSAAPEPNSTKRYDFALSISVQFASNCFRVCLRHCVINIRKRLVWYEDDRERSVDVLPLSNIRAFPTAHDINSTTSDQSQIEVCVITDEFQIGRVSFR